MTIFEDRFQNLSTETIMRSLLLTRIRFSNHPLYRRWSNSAYESRFVQVAEVFPEQIAQIIPLAFVTSPFVALFIALVFGTSTFMTIATIIGVLLLLFVLLIASGGPMVVAGLGALAVADEREAGRWELMMMIPQRRLEVLMMRISTILFPYRPLIDTLNILQTIAALILSFIFIGQVNRSGSDVFGICIVFILPVILLLALERRQDYALSVAMGSYAGLSRNRDTALSWAFSGVAGLLALRVFAGMLAFGLAPWEGGLPSIMTAIVGGPAVLTLISVNPFVTLVVLAGYYALREYLVKMLWHNTTERLQGWGG